jgi:Fur family ferric uptake transcriptional regulator
MSSASSSHSDQSNDIHERIAQDYAQIFNQDGRGQVHERIEVLRAVLCREGHFTVEDILTDLGQSADSTFVSNTLESFVHYGLTWAIRAEDKPVRYEHAHVQRHHDHVICVRCGHIQEVEVPMRQWLSQVEQSSGYRVLLGNIVLRGVCETCVSARADVFPLAAAAIGESLHVVRVDLAGPERKRLVAMGLAKGSPVEVLSYDGNVGSIIAVDQSRIAVSASVLQHVYVRPGRAPRCGAGRVTCPLTELGVGRSGRIVRIRGCGPMRHRLLEMGVTRGATVFVERVAPLGDPIEVTVKGYYLAIRKDEAAQILVEP